ncbi:hypothetical protein I4F81_009562 [Pyropia yezoensis]|uniref:Uncharacterized protein n=1 Tax=Pyropia yezoensis TaxID=2788 RepID=A0ACC3CA34_PYRYE|nr:hypothetical protein I4F81_009562 [Neopyropia yezoensis]
MEAGGRSTRRRSQTTRRHGDGVPGQAGRVVRVRHRQPHRWPKWRQQRRRQWRQRRRRQWRQRRRRQWRQRRRRLRWRRRRTRRRTRRGGGLEVPAHSMVDLTHPFAAHPPRVGGCVNGRSVPTGGGVAGRPSHRQQPGEQARAHWRRWGRPQRQRRQQRPPHAAGSRAAAPATRAVPGDASHPFPDHITVVRYI